MIVAGLRLMHIFFIGGMKKMKFFNEWFIEFIEFVDFVELRVPLKLL